MIIRLYEIDGKENEVAIEFPKPVKSARITDLTEMKVLGEIEVNGSKLNFTIGAYEIATLQVGF